MIALNNAPANAGLNAGRLPDWHQLVGLYALLPISIVAGLFSWVLDKAVIDSVLHSPWPIGAAVVLTIGLFVVVLAKRSRQICTPPRLAALCLASFSGVMLVTLVAMISMREIREATGVGLFGYLIRARYVLPLTVSWLGIVLAAPMLYLRSVLFSWPSFRVCSLLAQLLATAATSLMFWRGQRHCMVPRTSRFGGTWCKSRTKRVLPIYLFQIFRCNRSLVFPLLTSNFSSRFFMMNFIFRRMNMTPFSIGPSAASTDLLSI